MSLSFIAGFTNLQELVLSFLHGESLEDFKVLQYVTFIKFIRACPELELLVKFLEYNGKNLKELYINCVDEDNDNNFLNFS